MTTPILGQDVTADVIASVQENKINTPVTNAWVTGSLFGRLKLIGSYMKADGSNETRYVEADAGNFVSFEISRFFAGLGETVELAGPDGLLAGLGARRVRRHVQRAGRRRLVGEQPHAHGPGPDREPLPQHGHLRRQCRPATCSARSTPGRPSSARTPSSTPASRRRMLGPFSVNAGWSQLQQDVLATPDASEIIVPGGQGGEFERTVNTYGGGATFAACGVTLTGDYRHDDANQPIFRTDFINRDRYKFRGTLELQGLPQGRRGLLRDPRRRRHRRDRLPGEGRASSWPTSRSRFSRTC